MRTIFYETEERPMISWLVLIITDCNNNQICEYATTSFNKNSDVVSEGKRLLGEKYLSEVLLKYGPGAKHRFDQLTRSEMVRNGFSDKIR